MQVVIVNKTLSKPCPISSGDIQGGVLGSLLFFLYISDTFHIIIYTNPVLPAGEMKVLYMIPPSDYKAIIDNAKNDFISLDSRCRA